MFRYFAYDGVEMEVFPIKVEKISENYDVCADDAKIATSMEGIISYYNRVYENYDVYVLMDGTRGTRENSVEMLQSKIYDNRVLGITEEKLEELIDVNQFYLITFAESEYSKNLEWDDGYWPILNSQGYLVYLYVGNNK